MKPSAGSLQNVPLLSRGGMERIADKRKRDPRAAVDKNARRGASALVMDDVCSIDERFGSPSQIATNPPLDGFNRPSGWPRG